MSVELETGKRINSLIRGANATTGETRTNLTEAVKDLIDGYGQGGGADEIESIIDKSGVLDSTEGSVTEKLSKILNITDVMKKTKAVNFENDKTIETIDFYIDNIVSSLNNAFSGTTNLKTMVGINTAKVIHISKTFYNSGIVSIQEPFDFSSAISGYLQPFYGAEKLEDVRIVPETIKVGTNLSLCKMLSAESKQSIFDGLATVETAQTLTLHANAKILQSQVDSANAKGWTVAGGTVVSEEEYYG